MRAWIILGFLGFLGVVGISGAVTGFVAAAARARQGALTALGAGALALAFGLAGTVVSLVSSFRAVAHADPAHKARLLSESIRAAMSSTALGLAVFAVATLLGAFAMLRVSRLTKTAPPGEPR